MYRGKSASERNLVKVIGEQTVALTTVLVRACSSLRRCAEEQGHELRDFSTEEGAGVFRWNGDLVMVQCARCGCHGFVDVDAVCSGTVVEFPCTGEVNKDQTLEGKR